MTTTKNGRRVVLFIESSVGAHAALLLDADGDVLSRVAWSRQQSRQDNLDDLVESLGPGVGLVGSVVVDVGPGNLATTRACVAYANALGLALDVRLGQLNSLDVMTHMAVRTSDPIAAVRRAGPHGFYVRLAQPEEPEVAYSLLGEHLAAESLRASRVICSSQADIDALASAGLNRGNIETVVPTVDAMTSLWTSRGEVAQERFLEPLNESSGVFGGRT